MGRIPKQHLLILLITAAISVGGYFLLSRANYGMGFPLDDAWIHQTYARNLAELGEWSFIPGEPSAGSTSPLWTALLAIGHFFRIDPLLVTFLYGFSTLGMLSALGESTVRSLNLSRLKPLPWMGLFILLEWHFVWAAGSGMETLLFTLLVTWVLVSILLQKKTWIFLGVLAGITVWVRPDGLTLLGPLGIAVLVTEPDWKNRGISLTKLFFGFLGFFLPYLGFNYLLSGSWWPNTLHAKQAEYAILQQVPFFQRYLAQLGLPFVGAGSLLLPGMLFFIWSETKRKRWGGILPVLWVIGYLGLYAWRLPVTYQHGRYVIPVMPILFIIGFLGTGASLDLLRKIQWGDVINKIWVGSIAGVLVLFWFVGGEAYATDVRIIEGEMVEVAKWVAENTEPDALIAAHDIGALGYFGNRSLIDLAGLISPEVIPFMRDEDLIGEYLDQREADFLIVTFGWYPRLVSHGNLIYEVNYPLNNDQTYEHTQVYRWIRH